MSPSRGLSFLLRPRISIHRPQVRRFHDFIDASSNPANKTQIYISRSLNPYLNLSIEHYLLQSTPDDSTILFLYTNKPSIIIGRNQNPWSEVNLGVLGKKDVNGSTLLVRRRSGGGTVYHDEGNVNYSVICPTDAFDRDKHAEMVVRALTGLGVSKVKVNCRHDIVIDKEIDGDLKTFKISGSAYKLTRKRSLHHGTCLLSTKNLKFVSKALSSEAKPYITARGVASVKSAITTVDIPNEAFENAVVEEFSSLYDRAPVVIVGEDAGNVPAIAKGQEELESEDWIYGQTPQFTSEFLAQDGNGKGGLGIADVVFPAGFKANFTARHGRITEMSVKYNNPELVPTAVEAEIESNLVGRPLHQITDWEVEFSPAGSKSLTSEEELMIRAPGTALGFLFGNQDDGGGVSDRYAEYLTQHLVKKGV